MNSFANWLFKKISRKILSLPKSIVSNLILPYKEIIKDTPIFSLFISLIGVLTSSLISLFIFKISSKDSVLIVFIISSLFFVFLHIYLLISVQYDKYQLEKKKMWDTLKGDDEFVNVYSGNAVMQGKITNATGAAGLIGPVGTKKTYINQQKKHTSKK